MADVQLLATKADFDELSIIHFSADWAPQCKQTNQTLVDLFVELKGVDFQIARVEAEQLADVSLANQVTAVPTIVFFKAAKSVARVDGFNPAQVKAKTIEFTLGSKTGGNKDAQPAVNTAAAAAAASETKKESLDDRLKKLINTHRLTVFMKGDRNQPRCGFSRQVIQLLNDAHADYWTFDILENEEVRQGLKAYSNWPTYPQLYLDGELLGGLDVVREELQDGEFVARLPKVQ